MKGLVFFMAMFGVLGLRAQSIELFGFERQVQAAAFLPGDSLVVAYGVDFMDVDGKRQLGRKLIFWNAQSGALIREVELNQLRKIDHSGKELRGLLGLARISPDQSKLYLLGTQYQGSGTQIASVIHVYDLLNDSIKSFVIDSINRVTSFSINPSNQDELVCIYADESFRTCVGRHNLNIDSNMRRLKAYQHPWIPLACSFSSNNKHLFIGTGGGLRRGTLEVFDCASNKLMRTINLRENVTRILSTNERLYAVGESQTFVYRLDNFSNQGVNRNLIEQILTHSKSALLAPKHVEEMTKIRIQTLNNSGMLEWTSRFPMVQASFWESPNCIISIVEKDEFNQTEYNKRAPSLILVPLADFN